MGRTGYDTAKKRKQARAWEKDGLELSRREGGDELWGECMWEGGRMAQ